MDTDTSVEYHQKDWGYELWIVNNSLFCGKVLHVDAGKRCSFHYHKLKNEVFYIQTGKILLKYSFEDNIYLAKEIILNSGDKFEVPSELRHQFVALEDSDIFEISTQHFEDDSYRICR
jgi:mannose-6-phosphate isomerase-like protein (cupin superfamily)